MDNEYFTSINEVSRRLNVPAHTLRYWEKQFPVAIRPTTGAGGRRYYRAETVRRITTIRDLLYTRGMTIAGVKKLLRDGDFPADADAMQIAPAPQASAAPVVQSGPVVDGAAINAAIDMLSMAKKILAG